MPRYPDGTQPARRLGPVSYTHLDVYKRQVKCGKGREEADEWLARYPAEASVSPYIGRHGWNVLRLDGAIPPEEIEEAIDDSYDRIVATLPTKDRPPRS